MLSDTANAHADVGVGGAMGGAGLCGPTACEEAIFGEDCYSVYEEYSDCACQLAALLNATVRRNTVKEATEAEEEHFEE
jgi:hypothetical protein